MSHSRTTFSSPADQLELSAYRWTLGGSPARGVVQIAHGVAEHAGRYARLAEALNRAGYVVYAHDHRGHGDSIDSNVRLGSFGAAGWSGLVRDLVAFGQSVRGAEAALPFFLVAHSMGSFAAQQAILEHSGFYDGVVLSGSTALDLLAQGLTALGPGPVTLESLNAAFPSRTGYEWLSRDEAEVDKYVADPLSGFELAPDTIPQLFSGAAMLADPKRLDAIRNDLPILIASGTADPLAGGGQLIEALAARYRNAGLTDVTVSLYPDARHEIFNETNRDSITDDVVAWLDNRS